MSDPTAIAAARQRLQSALELLDGLRPLVGTKDGELWESVWLVALEEAKAAGVAYVKAAGG